MDANINFEKVKLIFEGVLVGLIAGTIVSSFRWIIENLLASYRNFYSLVQTQGNLVVLAGIIATLIVFVVINALLLKSEKNIAGSGIPQVELQLAGELKLNWWSILWKKYLGGIISIGPGLFLGREGTIHPIGCNGWTRFW
nr:chloride channel protein [Lactobacillus terrae]